MAFERVAGISDLPKHGGLRVEVGGREIGLWQVGGRVYAMENLCPHAGFPLLSTAGATRLDETSSAPAAPHAAQSETLDEHRLALQHAATCLHPCY